MGFKLDHERALDDSKIVRTTHRPHAKVTAVENYIVLKTGRVLGPKIDLKQKAKTTKTKSQRLLNQTGTMSMQTETSSSISLEDKLGLPLRALVRGKAKRSRNTTRR